MSRETVIREIESLTEIIKSTLLEQTDKLCGDLQTLLLQNKKKNSHLVQENKRLLRENQLYYEKIHEQDNRIESLLIEIRQNEYGGGTASGDRDCITDLSEKLSQVNTKKKIICDENERLKNELNLLKHQKLRDDKEYKDIIEELKEVVSKYENSDSNSKYHEQVVALKEEIEKKNFVIRSLKEAQENKSYYARSWFGI